jgi:hypothetical protein
MEREGRSGWIVSGGLAGAFLFVGILALLLVVRFPLTPSWECGHVGSLDCLAPPISFGVAGLLLGGFLGSHVLGISRRLRLGFGSVSGAVIGAVAGGSFALAVEVSGRDWPSGLAAFVTGAMMGGAIGLVIGWVTAKGSDRTPSPVRPRSRYGSRRRARPPRSPQSPSHATRPLTTTRSMPSG